MSVPGERRAVDGDEGLVAPRARLVERARDELLAGAGLAADEDRRAPRRRRGAPCGAPSPSRGDEPMMAATPHGGSTRSRRRTTSPAEREPLAEALDDGQEHLRAELVLEHVVLRAEAHRLADLARARRATSPSPPASRRPMARSLPEQVEPAAVARVRREADVEQEQVRRRLLARRRAPRRRRRPRWTSTSSSGRRASASGPRRALRWSSTIEDLHVALSPGAAPRHASRWRGAARRRSRSRRTMGIAHDEAGAAVPTRAASMLQPWARTMRWVIARPRPVPRGLVVYQGAKSATASPSKPGAVVPHDELGAGSSP